MNIDLEKIILRHFPDQPQVYPNRERARAAILEYAAMAASHSAVKPAFDATQAAAYWQSRAQQAEAREAILQESLRGRELVLTPPTDKYLGDPRFKVIVFPWIKKLALQLKDATAGHG